MTSLPHGVHVLVLDARSHDRTVEFARSAGASVFERDWTNFLDARRYALSLVATPWTLMTDADEALDDELRDAVVRAQGDVNGYVLRRTTYYCGKPLRMWSREPLLRLFRTDKARVDARGFAPLHETWSCDGPTAELRGRLLHYSYPDAASYRAKFAHYTAIEADAMRFSFARVIWEWLMIWPRWLWLLLRRGALLDGPRGIVAAYWSAKYRYVAACKAQ